MENTNKFAHIKETVKTIVISITVGIAVGAYGMHQMDQSNAKQLQAALKNVAPVAQAATSK